MVLSENGSQLQLMFFVYTSSFIPRNVKMASIPGSQFNKNLNIYALLRAFFSDTGFSPLGVHDNEEYSDC